jgi:hypothetical protein
LKNELTTAKQNPKIAKTENQRKPKTKNQKSKIDNDVKVGLIIIGRNWRGTGSLSAIYMRPES